MKKRHAVYVLMFAIFVVLSASFSSPVSAQTTPTATPYPAIAATATAAAQRIQQAQAQQAEADRLTQQAQAAQQAASAAYQQAQQDAANARAALQAQQYQQAGEALGRAEVGIETGKQQLDALSASYASLSGIVAVQAITITTQASELNQCRITAQTTNAAYNATAAKLQEAQSSAVNPVVLIACALIFVFLIAIVIILVIERNRTIVVTPSSSSRDAPRVNVVASADDVIDGDEQGEAE